MAVYVRVLLSICTPVCLALSISVSLCSCLFHYGGGLLSALRQLVQAVIIIILLFILLLFKIMPLVVKIPRVKLKINPLKPTVAIWIQL